MVDTGGWAFAIESALSWCTSSFSSVDVSEILLWCVRRLPESIESVEAVIVKTTTHRREAIKRGPHLPHVLAAEWLIQPRLKV